MSRPLVIVTTRLPPLMCGIGTYSWLSRKYWPEKLSGVQFVVMEGAQASRTLLGLDAVTEFNGNAGRLAIVLDRAGDSDVILHYAGRAYQRFGCPRWMPRVFSRWKLKFPQARLLIFFHELPAEVPITSRHFFPERINQEIVRKLTALADVVVTNTEHHIGKLRRLSGRGDLHSIPVGSNIEGLPSPSPERASDEFVVFGLPFGRLQTLQWFDSSIRQWHRSARLKKLHLIGPADGKFSLQADALIEKWPDPGIAIRHGVLPDIKVLGLLGRARFALTNITRETWSKSTGLMACAANGCVVVRRSEALESPPLCYTIGAAEVEKVTDSDLTLRTESLREWYRQNADWPVTAKRLANLLHNESRS